jgi:hypothetical protein
MRRIRKHAGLPALLALALVGIWVCVGLVHNHTGAPTCQICNALQFSTADLVAPPVFSAPTATAIAFLPAAAPSPAPAHHAVPQGRAPPTA